MEPSFKNVKEEFKNLNTDDIPIVTQEEIRLRNFIEEINIDESYIKNYLSESNMNDYMNLLPGAFSWIIEGLKELKHHVIDTASPQKGNHINMKQIKQTIQSLHLSANPSESKSPPAKSKSKVKPKKKAVANKSEVSSKANASVSEEVEHHPSSRMISVTPDIVEISDRNLMKVKKKHREHSNPKEEVHKNKHLKVTQFSLTIKIELEIWICQTIRRPAHPIFDSIRKRHHLRLWFWKLKRLW